MTGNEMTDEEIYEFIKERGDNEILEFTGVIVALAISHDLDIERVKDIAFIVVQDYLKEHQEDIETTRKFNEGLQSLFDEMFKDILGGNSNETSN